MTARGKKIRDTYLDKVDELAVGKVCLDDNNKFISSEIAKSLIIRALQDYERMYEVPRVDFWGQSFEE